MNYYESQSSIYMVGSRNVLRGGGGDGTYCNMDQKTTPPPPFVFVGGEGDDPKKKCRKRCANA